MTDTRLADRPRKQPNWGKAIAAIGISVATIAGLYLTKDPRCLLALVLIPIMYGML